MDGDLQHLIQQAFYALLSIVSIYGVRQLSSVKDSIDSLNQQVAKMIEKNHWHERELLRLENKIDKVSQGGV